MELTEVLGAGAAVLLVLIGAIARWARRRNAVETQDFDDDDLEDEELEIDEIPSQRYTPAPAHGLTHPQSPVTVTGPLGGATGPNDLQISTPTPPPAIHAPTPVPGAETPVPVAPPGVPAGPPPEPLDEVELLAARRRAARAGFPRRRKPRRRFTPVVMILVLGAIGGGTAFVVMRDRTPSLPEGFVIPPNAAAPVREPVPPPSPVPDTVPAASPDPGSVSGSGSGSGSEIGSGSGGANLVARMMSTSGNAQTAIAGTVVPLPLSIQVTDAMNQPVGDVRIAFRVTAGDGQIAPAEAVTDSRGRASAAWALGPRAGTNIVEATAPDYPGVRVQFVATGIPGPASVIRVIDGDAPSGAATTRQVTFRVEDDHGNPIANARIDVSVAAGGGSVRPSSLTTSPTGVAETTWSMSPESNNRLIARLTGSTISVEYEPPRFRIRSNTGIVAGGTHTCVLGAGGTYNCWGANDQGQLGSSADAARSARFATIAAGIAHTCGIDTQGRAHCWGANGSGQLGTGDRSARSSPTPVRTTTQLTDIEAGFAHSCALTASGAALCWGAGSDGQIGDGANTDRLVPATAGGGRPFIALTVGWRHTCAIAPDNTAWCWGSNTAGQLGDGTAMSRATPTPVAGTQRFRTIAAGATLTCGITTAGETYCWGQNMGGLRPTRVETSVRFRSLVTGAAHACGLTETGEAYCWGRNNFGQLGIDAANDAIVPARVAGGQRFASLSAGGSHTCGRTPLGQDFCWGNNVEGQLGDGTRIDRLAPARVTAR